MAEKLHTLVEMIIACVKEIPDEYIFVRDIANMLPNKFPDEVRVKKENSSNPKIKYGDINDIVNQYVSEISIRKDNVIKKDSNVEFEQVRGKLAFRYNTKPIFDRDAETARTFAVQEDKIPATPKNINTSTEKYLYPVLWDFLKEKLKVFSMQIREGTSSNKRGKGGNDWLHPDMVGLEDLSGGWQDSIKKLATNDAKARLWSFEVKTEISRGNVRSCYFQAVSNSSWANFGYLVANPIKDEDTMKELRMLSAVHGIGFIALDKNDINNSRIVIPARERADIDWTSANRLAENGDFKKYLGLIYSFYNDSIKPDKDANWPRPAIKDSES